MDEMRMINKSNHRNAIMKRVRLRRKYERRIKYLRFISALLIVMTIATFALSIRSFASDRIAAQPIYKYYTSYTVQEGETLNVLAKRLMGKEYASAGEYIAEVASINHIISASDIYAGQVIILPYYSTEKK